MSIKQLVKSAIADGINTLVVCVLPAQVQRSLDVHINPDRSWRDTFIVHDNGYPQDGLAAGLEYQWVVHLGPLTIGSRTYEDPKDAMEELVRRREQMCTLERLHEDTLIRETLHGRMTPSEAVDAVHAKAATGAEGSGPLV